MLINKKICHIPRMCSCFKHQKNQTRVRFGLLTSELQYTKIKGQLAVYVFF